MTNTVKNRPPAAERAALIAVTIGGATVELGHAPPEAYRQRHVDLNLDARQSNVVAQLFWDLSRRGEQLANGRIVNSAPDAVRWVLERIAAGELDRSENPVRVAIEILALRSSFDYELAV